jgi:hypothetical protein
MKNAITVICAIAFTAILIISVYYSAEKERSIVGRIESFCFLPKDAGDENTIGVDLHCAQWKNGDVKGGHYVLLSVLNNGKRPLVVRRPIPGLTVGLSSLNLVSGTSLPDVNSYQVKYNPAELFLQVKPGRMTPQTPLLIEALFGANPEDGLYMCRLTYETTAEYSRPENSNYNLTAFSNDFVIKIRNGKIASLSLPQARSESTP